MIDVSCSQTASFLLVVVIIYGAYHLYKFLNKDG